MSRKPTMRLKLSVSDGSIRWLCDCRVKISRALCGTPRRSRQIRFWPMSSTASSQARWMLRAAASWRVKLVAKLAGARRYSSCALVTQRLMAAALLISASSSVYFPLLLGVTRPSDPAQVRWASLCSTPAYLCVLLSRVCGY